MEEAEDEEAYEHTVAPGNFDSEDEEALEGIDSEEYEDDSEIVASEDYKEESLTSNLLGIIPSGVHQAVVAYTQNQKRFQAWFGTVKSTKTFFADEPKSNIDQLG